MSEFLETTALTYNSAIFSLSLFGLLAVASITIFFLNQTKKLKNAEEIIARLKTWWVIAGLLIGALALGRLPGIIFLAFVSFLALKEYFSIIPTRKADRRVLFWAYLTIPLQYYWVADAWFGV